MTHSTTPANGAQTPVNALLWLMDQPCWVAWRYQERAGKLTKPPVNPHTGADADVSDPATWGTHLQATIRQMTDDLAGLGIVLTGDNDLIGIDLDDAISSTGELAPWAKQIVEQIDSYTEVSPSGTGIHILAWGKLPPGRRRAGRVEMYDGQRYLTFTGKVLGERWALYQRTRELAAVHGQFLAAQPASALRAATPDLGLSPSADSLTLDDLAIVNKAFSSRAGARIARLWMGDASDYASASEADLALCVHLAFYTQDENQIRRLVAMSAAGKREKWQRADYAAMTISRAITTRGGTYSPNWAGNR
ncbi:MAG: hypothetical protein WAZ19_12705 [Anaerolineae bacterium]